MTEAEKMVAGLPYDIMAPELKALRRKAHQAIYAYNRSDPLEDAPQSESLAGLLGSLGSDVFVETPFRCEAAEQRSEEHTSELQSLMRSSYAVFCLKKKN